MKQTILLIAVCMAIGSTNSYAKSNRIFSNEETPAKKNSATVHNSASVRNSATVRNILSDKLPAKLRTTIKKEYRNYWISGLYKETVNGKNSYHITLENADKIVVLSAAPSANWSIDSALLKDRAAM